MVRDSRRLGLSEELVEAARALLSADHVRAEDSDW